MVEKRIMISIDDERAKYISEVISNKSCKKIIYFLSERDATVSEISRELKMPINTTDYNVKKLEKSGLIERKSFWWSTRGKKMPTYTVSNKEIIISPKKKESFLKYLYALIITGTASLLIKLYSIKNTTLSKATIAPINEGVLKAVETTQSDTLTNTAQRTIEVGASSSTLFGIEIWVWFLIGAWSAVFIFFIISIISDKKS